MSSENRGAYNPSKRRRGESVRLRSVYYGWTIAGTLALTETVSWGVLYYAFAVFLVPMQEDLGWSQAAITGAFSLALLVSGALAPLVGRWLDRYGPRLLMTVGSSLGAALILVWASVENLWAFYLVWAGIGAAMAATLYEPAFAVVARWFERGRNRALLLITFAAGFASTIFLPLSGWLVEAQGWREALVTLAIMLAVLTIAPHALVLRRRPEDLGLRPDGANVQEAKEASETKSVPLGVALRGTTLWLLSVTFFLGTLSQVAIGVHLIPYLGERGYGLTSAAFLTGCIGAAQVLGRVLVTFLGSRLPREAVTTGVFGLQAAALVVLLVWQSPLGLWAFVVAFGAASGAATLTRASLIAELYGIADYGSIGGVVAMFTVGARAVAPVGISALYLILGGYVPALWTMVAGSALAAVFVFLAQRARPDKGPAGHRARPEEGPTTAR